MKRKFDDIDPNRNPNPALQGYGCSINYRFHEDSICFPSWKEANDAWENDIWRWYLSWRLSQDTASIVIDN